MEIYGTVRLGLTALKDAYANVLLALLFAIRPSAVPSSRFSFFQQLKDG